MIKVLLVDDHEMFRDGMKALINKIDWVEVLAEAENGVQAIDLLKNHHIDMIVTDIQMPEMDGIELTRKVREQYPDIKIVALTMVEDSRFVQKIKEAGAHGYITKTTNLEKLTTVLENINLQSNQFQIAVSEKEISVSKKQSSIISGLTPRELEILALIANGLTDKAIANKLQLSPYTVISHRKNLLIKLGLSNKVELARFALENGLASKDFLE